MMETNTLAVHEQSYGSQQVALIKETVCKGASDLELSFFLSVARRTGLDPIARQIYSVPRKGTRVIQVAIDGYRLIAQRTGEYAGNDEPLFDTEEGKNPNIARVTVWRLINGEPRSFTGIARWGEFKPPPGQDDMWNKMPWHMLAMAAERQALRKAFPQELAGIEASDDPHADDAPAREIRTAPVRIQPPQIARPAAGGSSRSQLRDTVANVTASTVKATVMPTQAQERPIVTDEDGVVIESDRDALMTELTALRAQRFDVDGYLRRHHPDTDLSELTDAELLAAVETGRKVAKK
jgi:phage recombination protein Bet